MKNAPMYRIMYVLTALIMNNVIVCSQQYIDDIHVLNRTAIHGHYKPQTIKEIQDLVQYAQQVSRPISIAAKRHSQGGQQFAVNAVVIDLSNFNKILGLNREEKTITVQAGIDWCTIQNYIDQYDLALQAMQHANCFTVGGSIAAHAHGPDLRYPFVAQAIKSFTLLCADGKIITVSLEKQSDLFKAVIGGYGLLGIVLEVTLYLTDNSLLHKKTYTIPSHTYVHELMTKVIPNKNIHMHHGYLSVDPSHLFSHMKLVNCVDAHKKAKQPLKHIWKPHVPLLHALWQYTPLIKKLQFTTLGLITERAGTVSRNNAMRYAPTEMRFDDPSYCNILQEYFIPIEWYTSFLRQAKRIFKKHKINVLAAITRYVPANDYALLNHSPVNCISIVFLCNHLRTEEQFSHARVWTQELISSAQNCGGSFYLVSYPHATQAQVDTAYPQKAQFKSIKKIYDPQNRFINTFYKTYLSL